MRAVAPLAFTVVVVLAGCIGPVALHEVVLRYDESVGRLEEAREVDVAPDPRTAAFGSNARRTLGIDVNDIAKGA